MVVNFSCILNILWMVWNFVVDGIMSAWFPCKINCIYVVKFDFLYQLSWWQNEKFPNLQRNMQITRTLVTCINAITCRNKNMQIRAYIYFECQTFSHDTHDKKKIHGFFPKKYTWLDGEFGDIFWVTDDPDTWLWSSLTTAASSYENVWCMPPALQFPDQLTQGTLYVYLLNVPYVETAYPEY